MISQICVVYRRVRLTFIVPGRYLQQMSGIHCVRLVLAKRCLSGAIKVNSTLLYRAPHLFGNWKLYFTITYEFVYISFLDSISVISPFTCFGKKRILFFQVNQFTSQAADWHMLTTICHPKKCVCVCVYHVRLELEVMTSPRKY